MLTPPENSNIKVVNKSGLKKIIIPQPSGGIFRFFIGAFLFFWLGGWAVGWRSTAAELFNTNSHADVLLIFWFFLWNIVGIFAIWILYKIFRPSVPESIVLSKPKMYYDSGVAPFKISFSSRSQMGFWKKLFQRRLREQIGQSQLKTISLRKVNTTKRLTIDKGNKRFDLATGATESDREWLFKVLKKYYHS